MVLCKICLVVFETQVSRLRKSLKNEQCLTLYRKDILSDFIESNRSVSNFLDYSSIYNYGFLASYGIGFGFPLLVGLPEPILSCDENDFVKHLEEYELSLGVKGLLGKGYKKAVIESHLKVFKRTLQLEMACMDGYNGVEKTKLNAAFENLHSAMKLRASLEE